MDEILDGLTQIDCDILVIGGGTAGPMAALKAKRKNPEANVVLLDKAHVKRSGRDLDGDGRAEQLGDPGLRHARAVHQGNHHRE